MMKFDDIYNEILRIASLPKQEAYEAIPDFMNMMFMPDLPDVEDSSIEFGYLQDSYRDIIEECRHPRYFNENACRRFVDDLLADSNYQGLCGQFGAQISAMIDKVNQLRSEAMPNYYEHMAKSNLNTVINNLGTRDRILKECRETLDYFKYNDIINPEIIGKIEKIMFKAAIYRAKKRLNEAKIAYAGNNSAKGDRIAGEAVEMLRQDWELIFNGFAPPDITDI